MSDSTCGATTLTHTYGTARTITCTQQVDHSGLHGSGETGVWWS